MIRTVSRAMLLAVGLGWGLIPAALADSGQDIVAASDKIRNPGQPFRLTNTLTEFSDGKPVNQTTLVVLSKENPQTGKFASIVRYAAPARDEGKLVLMDGSKMWYYDPASKASVRLSAQQRLLGQASNGDVVTVNFARDYTAKLVGEETIKDSERKDRQAWHLDMVPTGEDAVYGRIEYWVEKGTYYPIKGKFYTDSGRVLKLAYYGKIEKQLGGMRPTEAIIIDAVDPKQVTKMSYSDYRAQDIPAAWFQREYLPRLKID